MCGALWGDYDVAQHLLRLGLQCSVSPKENGFEGECLSLGQANILIPLATSLLFSESSPPTFTSTLYLCSLPQIRTQVTFQPHSSISALSRLIPPGWLQTLMLIVWLISGRSGLHVQPYRWDGSPHHAQGLCNCWMARQPHSLNVPGLHEVGACCICACL